MEKNSNSHNRAIYNASEYFGTKAYLNPNVINYATRLSPGDTTISNKIHVNPNFNGTAVYYSSASVQEKSSTVHINPHFNHGNRGIFKCSKPEISPCVSTLNSDVKKSNQHCLNGTYNEKIFKSNRCVVNKRACQGVSEPFVNMTSQTCSSSTPLWYKQSKKLMNQPLHVPHSSTQEADQSYKKPGATKLTSTLQRTINPDLNQMYIYQTNSDSHCLVNDNNNKFKLLNPYKIVNSKKVVPQSAKDRKMYTAMRKKMLPLKAELTHTSYKINNLGSSPKFKKHKIINSPKYKCSNTVRKVPLNKVANLIRLKYIYKNKALFSKNKQIGSMFQQNNTYKLDKRRKVNNEKRNILLYSSHKNMFLRKGDEHKNKFQNPPQKPFQWKVNWNKYLHQTVSKNRMIFEQFQQRFSTPNPYRIFPRASGIMYKSAMKKLNSTENKQVHFTQNKINVVAQAQEDQKHHIVYVRGEKFLLGDNGKVLIRQLSNVEAPESANNSTVKRVDIGGVTYIQKSSNVLIQTKAHQARFVLNYARQRSIAVLHNLNKKNNMPCIIFQRFGRCMRHNKGTCTYVHDPKNIDLCKKFLKGQCVDTNCLLSHNVVKEKVDTCHFFLNGSCNREKCPFLHVKVNKKAAICNDFLRGFCSRGQNCLQRHVRLCPDFDEKGTCNRRAKCPYPHNVNTNRKYKGLKNSTFSKGVPKSIAEKQKLEKSDVCQSNYKNELRSGKIRVATENGKTKVRKRKWKKLIKKVVSVQESENDSVIECIPKRIRLENLPLFIPLNTL